VFIPWADFGLKNAPKENTVWQGTINRIDSSVPRGTNQGFLCLLDEPEVISFHQPEKFAAFSIQDMGSASLEKKSQSFFTVHNNYTPLDISYQY
jgi:hypothetical protein